jgi:phosphatidylserine/phosphatidylglycerophosphate/cardiolipin synthase-like enzyme
MLALWRRHILVLGVAALGAAVAAGCGGSSGGDGDGGLPDGWIRPDGWTPPDGWFGGDGEVPPPDAPAYLELYVLDIWAQPLPQETVQLAVTRDGEALATYGYPVATVPLDRAGAYEVTLAAPRHDPLAVTVTYDGSDRLDAAQLGADHASVRHGLSMSHERRTLSGAQKPVHTAYLGLRHTWFAASGRPARHGNHVELLMDGEQAWERIHADLQQAQTSIHLSTWWWESNFELVRPAATHINLTTAERWANTILGTLEQSPAYKRVLVGQFWGQDSILSWMTTDAELRVYAEAAGDGFDFMGQANETAGTFWFEVSQFRFGDRVRAAFSEAAPRTFDGEAVIASTVPPHMVDLTQWPVGVEVEHASYHQKFGVIDDDRAYIGGMNFRRVDWDTSAHQVFDWRRMLFDATPAARQAVYDRTALPDTGPRKDYIVRVEGPAAQDAAEVFHERWEYLLGQGVEYSQVATPFTVKRDLPALTGGTQVQVTATLPEPFWEHAIGETWFNAVRNATDSIYIEDQYFRIPMLVDAITARMTQVPALKLVVITKPINEWTDPGCYWTYRTAGDLAAAFPGRFLLLQLRAFDYVDVGWGVDETESRFQDMDVHSKVLIVDDTFMSVGSANKNNRGIVYEGELNVAVADATFVRAARKRIFANFLPPGTPDTDSSATWWQSLKSAAEWNDYVYGNWEAAGGDLDLNGAALPEMYRPYGFLYSLAVRDPSNCLIETIGPDMV